MATRGNLKLPDHKGSLDAEHHWMQGLMAKRMRTDPFFFLQLIFPVCNARCLGIEDNGRMPLFSVATVYTYGYTILEKGWGGGYVREYKLVTKQKLVWWVGVPICHGTRDGRPPAYTGTGVWMTRIMTTSLLTT
jgi:hypothetical protein